jgi:crotonobetainyl-CoA:carnitine CoA-transferase CaiB-like acyl-CoA transferase
MPASNADRVTNAVKLDEYISAWCHARSRETAIEELTDMGGAVGPLETVETMLHNPQVLARESVTRVPDPLLGQIAMANVFPASQPQTAPWAPRPAVVGQHTDEVLAHDLGLNRRARAAAQPWRHGSTRLPD